MRHFVLPTTSINTTVNPVTRGWRKQANPALLKHNPQTDKNEIGFFHRQDALDLAYILVFAGLILFSGC